MNAATPRPTATAAIGAAIDRAEPVPIPVDREAPDEGDGGSAHQWLPADCPITPLGIYGDCSVFLDAIGQLRVIQSSKIARPAIVHMAGTRIDWLYDHWPRLNKDGEPLGGLNVTAAQDALMAACAAKGVWNPTNVERGPGAWADEDGALVIHYGNRIWHERLGWHSPGEIGRHVYCAGPAQPRPQASNHACDDGIADLHRMLQTWAWQRPELDARLVVGWLGMAMIGGALRWRPSIWVTGRAGSGKSTLLDVMIAVLDRGLIHIEDVTAAAIKTLLAVSSIPVILDEKENEGDNRRTNDLITLMRLAASGGGSARSSADHRVMQTELRSAFAFSSILIPPLLPQDKSRVAVLDLGRLGDQPPLALDYPALRATGAAMRRRMIQGWRRWPELLSWYQDRMREQAHDARGADVYGTLLAAAHVVLDDGQPSHAAIEPWLHLLSAEDLAARSDREDDEVSCLHHLLASQIEPSKGSRRTVSEVIQQAMQDVLINGMRPDESHGLTVLQRHGMRLEIGAPPYHLVVANRNPSLAPLYRGQRWGTASGTDGSWSQSLRRLDGAIISGAVRFAGVVSRGVAIPVEPHLASLLPPSSLPSRSPKSGTDY